LLYIKLYCQQKRFACQWIPVLFSATATIGISVSLDGSVRDLNQNPIQDDLKLSII